MARGNWVTGFVLALSLQAAQAPPPGGDAGRTIHLTVPAGTPLRLAITKRFSKRKGARVSARVIEPVYAFDREVIPAGSIVSGEVNRTQHLTKWGRAQAIVRGDFTPLRISMVRFDSLLLPDGRKLALDTVETPGLDTLYIEPRKKKSKAQPPAKPGLKQKIKNQIDARVQPVTDAVRAPDKKERLVDFALAKLPYHPQYVRRNTRFDAELHDPLSFGTETVAPDASALLGTQPPPDSAISARLLTPVDSGTAKQGEPMEAVLTAPVFGPGHKLVLPEGTLLKGAVVMSRRARWLHRSGRLRFNFLDMELPPEAAALRAAPRAEVHTQAILKAAESSGKTPVKVDSEGGTKATEPKTRFLAPVLSWMVASRAADNDAGHVAGGSAATQTAGGNVGGRTLGGGLGFGLIGSAVSQSSRYVGMAFGYYGLAWSVYSNLIARGPDVYFAKDAVLELKFGGRPAPKETSK